MPYGWDIEVIPDRASFVVQITSPQGRKEIVEETRGDDQEAVQRHCDRISSHFSERGVLVTDV